MAILLIALLVMLISVGAVLWQSKETLAAVLNTDYPGKRVETGGKWGHILFDSPFAIFYTLTGLSWERGMDVMYDCLPLVLPLSAYVWRTTKDKLLSVLFVLNAFFWVYITFGFPEWLAKATLMSYSFGVRVVAPFGIVMLLLLIRVLSLPWQLSHSAIKKWRTVLAVLSIGLALLLHYDYFDAAVLNVPSSMMIGLVCVATLIAFGVVWIIYGLILKRQVSGLVLAMGVASLFFGGMVNPLRQGVRVIEDNRVVQTMKQVHAQESGIWIVDDLTYPYTNIPLLAGVPSINVTNVYPYVERWKQFDTDLSDKVTYNRYAHIQLVLDNAVEDVAFQLTLPDSFTARLNTNHLKVMNVRYVISRRDLTPYTDSVAQLEVKEQVNGFFIYKVTYK